jgi:hypothetical protein
MSAEEKTQSVLRKNLPIGLLVKNAHNPNEMGAKEFNLLVSNMEATGVTDPLLVRPIEGGKYRIVGGHHRFDACELLGFQEIPCTIITDPNFDDDMEKFQIVRMNMIRGKLNTKKFLTLYDSLDKKYAADIMADAFGFADEDAFKKIIGEMAATLPNGLQTEFKNAAKEIKTIDGLTKLLNLMFTKYGDTLPYGYMMVDFGGKESVWLRMAEHDMKKFKEVADLCVEKKRSVDALFRLFLQSIAAGNLPTLLTALEQFPEVSVEKGKIPVEG